MHGRYENAYRLAHYLSGLHSKNFDVWFLLAKIFLKMENYEYALTALNVSADCIKYTVRLGSFPDVSMANTKLSENPKNASKITQPKDWGSINSFANIFVIN